MRRPVAVGERVKLIGAVSATAFRLEQQRSYAVDVRTGWPARWLDGDRTPPTDWDEGFDEWFAFIRSLTESGRRIERIRVVDRPPTDYQRWEEWLGQWNVGAGEVIRYLPRSTAVELGIAEQLGDWWLFDDQQLLQMMFDDDGNELPMILTDEHPEVERARSLWATALPLCVKQRAYHYLEG